MVQGLKIETAPPENKGTSSGTPVLEHPSDLTLRKS